VEATFFEISAPKDVEVSSIEVYGTFLENSRGKYMAFEKHRGLGNHPHPRQF